MDKGPKIRHTWWYRYTWLPILRCHDKTDVADWQICRVKFFSQKSSLFDSKRYGDIYMLRTRGKLNW